MAHSLETRVPFLDNDLVDFAMRLPVRCKIGKLNEVIKMDENEPGVKKTSKYFQKTNDGKLLLRKMMERYVPKNIVDREKQGFSAPDSTWFRGDSIDFVKRKLIDGDSRIYKVLNHEVVKNLVKEHLDGKENRRLLIWSLLNVDYVIDNYFQYL